MVPGTVQFLMSLLRGDGPGLAQMEEKLLPLIKEYQPEPRISRLSFAIYWFMTPGGFQIRWYSVIPSSGGVSGASS